jgi:hypothetical protein
VIGLMVFLWRPMRADWKGIHTFTMLVRAGRLSLASQNVVGRGEVFHHLLLREWK